jgi:hypothetical protein
MVDPVNVFAKGQENGDVENEAIRQTTGSRYSPCDAEESAAMSLSPVSRRAVRCFALLSQKSGRKPEQPAGLVYEFEVPLLLFLTVPNSLRFPGRSVQMVRCRSVSPVS